MPTFRRPRNDRFGSTEPKPAPNQPSNAHELRNSGEEGLAAHKQFTDPEQFMEKATHLYLEWAKEQREKPPSEAGEEEEAASVSLTVEKAEEMAWEEVRNHLQAMDPYEFQHLVAGLLRGMGYHVSFVAPPGKDRGVDIIAEPDPLGTQGPRVKVQVKREQSKTDAKTHRRDGNFNQQRPTLRGDGLKGCVRGSALFTYQPHRRVRKAACHQRQNHGSSGQHDVCTDGEEHFRRGYWRGREIGLVGLLLAADRFAYALDLAGFRRTASSSVGSLRISRTTLAIPQ